MRSDRAFRIVAASVLALSVGAAAWLGAREFRKSEGPELPIAAARRGEFVVVIATRGQIQAQREAQIYAPLVPDLRIAWMAPPGELVAEGAPLVRFDSTTARQELIERQAALEQAAAALAQAEAEGRIARRRDEAALADARLEVESARLGTAANEFVGRIQAEQNQIDLRVAEENLRALEAETALGATSTESNIAALARQMEAAQAEVALTEARLDRMEIRAPLAGYPIFANNATQLLQTNPQPFRVGDSVSGGVTLAVIPDLTSLYMDVTVEEVDRGRIEAGDEVRIRIDALPELVLPARLTAISPLAEFSLDTLSRSFHAAAALGPKADPRLRPGMNGAMDVIVRRIPDAVAIPAAALFTRNGKPAVYQVENGVHRPVPVEVLARNPDEVAVAGLAGDARVALVDPEEWLAAGAAEAAEEGPP